MSRFVSSCSRSSFRSVLSSTSSFSRSTSTSFSSSFLRPAFTRSMAFKAGDRRFTKDHEYLLFTSANEVTIGITDYAQKELGDVVFVDLPEAGTKFSSGDSFASVESVKAASSVYAPADIEVLEKNEALVQKCALINESAEKDGWMIKAKLSKPEQAEQLMDAGKYKEHVKAAEAAH